MRATNAGTGHRGGQRRPWLFNPFEVAVCGYQNTGKTTLLAGLARTLADELRLAYLKHDVHGFAMDHPGKDTDRLRAAGACSVRVQGPNGFGHLGQDDEGPVLSAYALLAADAVLVEGHKGSRLPRIALLDEALTILDDAAFTETAPIAFAHPWPKGGRVADEARAAVRRRFGELPWFCRDDLGGIADLIRGLWRSRVPAPRGLVLTGGHSTRMGQDKALLDYHGCTQLEFAVRTLGQVCPDVMVSCRPDQVDEAVRGRFPLLPDRFLDLGPTGGLLTALGDPPALTQSWLVLACDLPRVDVGVLRQLMAERDPFRFATAFRGEGDFPEPLCAIWEPKAYPRLLQFVGMGQACPRKCLIQSPIRLLDARASAALDNGNSPSDHRRIRGDLGASPSDQLTHPPA